MSIMRLIRIIHSYETVANQELKLCLYNNIIYRLTKK